MKKRIIALLLSASMVVTCFTGCGDKSSDSNNKVSNGEDVTLEIMVSVDTSRSTGLNENAAILALEEATGVDLEFTEVSSAEWSEELSLTLASKDLPDIILGSMKNADLVANIQAGNIIDLKPYIEESGENIQKLMDSLEGFEQVITISTGEIASLPNMSIQSEDGKCPQSLFYVYQPWLDKLGLPVPTTAEEFYDTLVAFKKKDPNGNGQADEIPLLPRNQNNFYELFSMFGIVVQSSTYFNDIDGEIVFTPFTQNFKDGLTYLRKLYKEGLVNEKVFTDSASQTLAKGAGEVAVAGSTVAGAAFAVVGEERQEEMTQLEYIAADGYDMAWLNRASATAGRFMVTKDCENPEAAVKVWDYLFSEEGAKLYWMGTEDNYTWNEDKTSWTWNLEEGQTLEELRAEKTIQTTCTFAAGFPQDWFKQVGGSETLANNDRLDVATKYADNLRRAIPDGLQYDRQTESELSIYLADINSYVNSCLAQFITGKMDIEKDWSSFTKQCETLKVDKAIEIMQEAYDAYEK